jgi:uncharacterized membrane protein YgcG
LTAGRANLCDMSNHASTNPRRWAYAARAAVVVGSGLAVGLLSSHFYTGAVEAAAKADQGRADSESVEPVVVTKIERKHVESDPIIIYKKVPVPRGTSSGSSGSGSGSSSSSGSSGSSGAGAIAPAPKPQPVAPQAPATSSRSS